MKRNGDWLRWLAAALVLGLGLAVAARSYAGIVTAASPAQASVQAAINSASTGDTVMIPAGSATWSGAVSIPSNKKIVLQGAGRTATVITRSAVGNSVLILNLSGARVTGIRFVDGYIEADGDGWRVDHCDIYSASTFIEGVYVRGTRAVHPTGLVDHNTFTNARVVVYGTAAMLAENDYQHRLWAAPLNLGSANNVVYVEDNTFTFTVFGNVIDANYGGSYVFRYNTVTDVYLEAHSVQGDNRAARKWEIYNNTFRAVNMQIWVPMFLRGGTGVVFNNTITGTWSAGIALNNVRDTEVREVCGICDGTSNWDQNTAGQAGYSCRDQIGRGGDVVQWAPGQPYNQSNSPAYLWGNTMNGSPIEVFVHNSGGAVHIVKDRDYFVGTPKPGYVPYTYPHPLALDGGGDTNPPNPPTGLRVIGP